MSVPEDELNCVSQHSWNNSTLYNDETLLDCQAQKFSLEVLECIAATLVPLLLLSQRRIRDPLSRRKQVTAST